MCRVPLSETLSTHTHTHVSAQLNADAADWRNVRVSQVRATFQCAVEANTAGNVLQNKIDFICKEV